MKPLASKEQVRDKNYYKWSSPKAKKRQRKECIRDKRRQRRIHKQLQSALNKVVEI